LAGLVLWGFWRWLRIQQSNQRILANPLEQLQAPPVDITNQQRHVPLSYLETDALDDGYQVTTPKDQVPQWLDEIKSKLRSDDKKDEDDNSDN
jgi:hypothetical protein